MKARTFLTLSYGVSHLFRTSFSSWPCTAHVAAGQSLRLHLPGNTDDQGEGQPVVGGDLDVGEGRGGDQRREEEGEEDESLLRGHERWLV